MRKKLPLFIALGALTVWVVLDLPCPIRAVLGIPCPGCGMSRAWLAALRLDLRAAFAFHPLFWCVPPLLLFALADGKLFKKPLANVLFAAGSLAGLLVCWALRLAGVLPGLL